MGLVLLCTLAAVTLTDLEQRIIPNSILAVSAAIGVAIAAATDPSSLAERAIAAAAAGGFFLLAALACARGMGMGDVKLAALIGFYLGRYAAPAILAALLAGAIAGLAIVARQGAQARKQALPFGPFLAFGALLGLLAGNRILDWYLDGFLNS